MPFARHLALLLLLPATLALSSCGLVESIVEDYVDNHALDKIGKKRWNKRVRKVVERILPGSVLRGLTDAEMDVYRRPFAEAGEGRRPTLTWPRELPIGGEPADVVEIVKAYGDWLSTSDLPKLLVNAEPGAILKGRQLEFARSWPNTTEVTVAGNHFIQEDSPHQIGDALREWYAKL